MPEERASFLNSLPALYEALKKVGREDQGRKIIEDFLVSSFSDDLPDKVQRFLRTGIGLIPAERICYDILTKHKLRINGVPLSEKQISCLYKMNLVYLFKLLYEWGLIKKETRDEMYKINERRNSYVHPKRTDLNAKKDSLRMNSLVAD